MSQKVLIGFHKLPDEYEKELDTFMKSINLNTGSLDIMKTKEDNI